jgi:hypothetical protein
MTSFRYAFQAGRVPAGTDPVSAIALVTAPGGSAADAPLGAHETARRRATVAAVERRLPGLVEPARVRGRVRRTAAAIDLALPRASEDDPSLRFRIYADRVDVSLLVRPHDPRLRADFERAWEGLRALDAAGFTIYDPQRGRLVDLAHDLEAVVGQFQTETAVVVEPSGPKPWWRFWSRG